MFIGGSSLAGSGALGALVLAFMAGQGWKKEEKASESGVRVEVQYLM